MLTQAELDAMRQLQQSAMPDTATVQRATTSTNDIGEALQTWANVGTYNCRVARTGVRPQETEASGALAVEDEWVITFPHDADVQEGDRVVVGGSTFDVRAVENARSWLTALRVRVVRV